MSAKTRERIDTRAIEDGADLLALAGAYTELDRTGAGPCPKCGGDDRFHLVRRGGRFALWTCRRCREGRHEGPIGLIMWAEDLPFLEAVGRLTGETPAPRTIAPARRSSSAPIAAQTPEQLAELGRVARLAAERIAAEEGGRVRAALVSRGLTRATWRAFGIGAAVRPVRVGEAIERVEAVAIPYVGLAGVVGIRYRALEPLPPKKPGGKPRRYFSHRGSVIVGGAFGLPLLDPSRSRALVVVEGELNAASVYQAVRPSPASEDGAGWVELETVPPDVMSPGSESADLTPFRGVAALYDRVLVWADTGAKTARILDALAHPNAGGISGEDLGGRDANDVLRADPDELRDLLRARCAQTPSVLHPVAQHAGIRACGVANERVSVAPRCAIGATPPASPARVGGRSEAKVDAISAHSGGVDPAEIEASARALLAALERPEWRDARPDLAAIGEEARTLAAEYRAAIASGGGEAWRRSRTPRLAHLIDAIEGRAVYEHDLVGEALALEIHEAFATVNPPRMGAGALGAYYAECRALDGATSGRIGKPPMAEASG